MSDLHIDMAAATLASLLPIAVYTCDVQGRVNYFNSAAVELWGRIPHMGEEFWCGSAKVFYADGKPMPPEEYLMAIVLREGRHVSPREIIIERPDGTRRNVLVHPQPMWRDGVAGSTLIGAMNMMLDVTERRQAEASLQRREELYRQLVSLMPAAVYTIEAPSGRITFFNEHAVTLWGRTPDINSTEETFCGSFRLYWPDGRRMPHHETPMAAAIFQGKPTRNDEVVIERQDGSRLTVMVNIDPIMDQYGRITGAINVFHEISSFRAAQLAQAQLAAIIESSDDAIISKGLDGYIRTWNKSAERLFGYSASEAIGKHITMLIPPDRLSEETEIIQRLSRGERIEHFDTVRVAKDGTKIDISLTISPIRDDHGRVIGASKIARDIRPRKAVEQELERFHAHLQEMVETRTAELAQAQQKLLMTERVSSLGTIAAGLGHDIGNLLMPMAAHLGALQAHVLHNGATVDPNVATQHFDAIQKSFDYLRHLAGGLRLMAIDPSRRPNATASTNVNAWWEENYPLLRAVLSSKFALHHEFGEALPEAAIPSHLLTQAVFNIVQNAGQALSGRSHGVVRLTAVLDPAGESIRLSVTDNGPGMNAEIRNSCVEPFFTTKTRGISTGLGLALVNGIMQDVNGSLLIESEPGCGSTFTLRIPVSTATVDPTPSLRAVLSVRHPRLRALLRHALTADSFQVMEQEVLVNGHGADLYVVDDHQQNYCVAIQAMQQQPRSRVLMFDDQRYFDGNALTDSNIIRMAPTSSFELLRKTIHTVKQELSRTRLVRND